MAKKASTPEEARRGLHREQRKPHHGPAPAQRELPEEFLRAEEVVPQDLVSRRPEKLVGAVPLGGVEAKVESLAKEWAL